MTIRHDIAAVLTSRECQHINFEIFGIRATGELFRRAAARILDTSPPVPIRISTNPAMVGRDAALYDTLSDTLSLRGTDIMADPFETSVVVHECVHIITDMRRVPVVGMDDEAAGYIAETWFLLNRGQRGSVGTPAMIPIVENILVRSGGAGNPASVTQDERHQIHLILRGERYTWENTRYARPDGVRGDRGR